MKNYNYKYKYVISKTPYRISLGGGGTDLPFYSYKKGGDLNASVEVGGSELYEPRCWEHFFSGC